MIKPLKTFCSERGCGESGRDIGMSLDGSAGWRPSALRRAGLHAHPGLGPLQLVEETASGRLAWREWAVGRLLTATTQSGDGVPCTAERRLAHPTFHEPAITACSTPRGGAVPRAGRPSAQAS